MSDFKKILSKPISNMEDKFDNKSYLEEIVRDIEDDEYSRMVLESGHYLPIYHNDTMSSARVLIIHLLKLNYQPEKQSSSWIASIRDNFVELHDTIIKDNGKIDDKNLNTLIDKFDYITNNAVGYASEETGIDKKKLKFVYGMSKRSLLSKDWLIYYIKKTLTEEPLRTDTLKNSSKFMKKINSIHKIDKYALIKLDDILGEVNMND